MQTKSRHRRFPLVLGTLALLSLSGCQTTSVGVNPAMASPDELAASQAQAQLQGSTSINPTWMYDILVAETLAIAGDFLNAHHVMMRVAKQSQDVELAERAFHFAMSGYYGDGISASASLWRSIDPLAATPWRIGYVMALRNGKAEAALAAWQNYRDRSTETLETDLKHAASQVGQGIEADVALTFFEQLYQAHRDDWSAGYIYGFVADHYQQAELAADILEEVIAQDSAGRDAYFALMNLYLDQDWYERGLMVLADYIAMHPEDWTMQERFARLEVRAQRYDAAEARYKRIVANNSQARASELSLALLLLDRGDFDAAIKHFNALLEQQAYQDIVHYYLGLIYHGQNQWPLARHHLNRVKDDTYLLDAQLILAQIDFDEQGLDVALSRLASFEAVDQTNQLKIWRAKGSFYSQAEQWPDAVKVYREAYAQNTELLPLIYAYGLSLYNASLDQEYEAVMKRALQHFSDEPDLLNALGYFYAEKGVQLKEAERLLDRALALAPEAFHILDSRGWLAYQQGEFELAEQLISQAWSIQQDEEVLLHLIKVKWALQKFAEAEALWQDHHQDYADNLVLQEVLIKLQAGY